MKLLLSGEGPDDIGDWAKESMYRADPHSDPKSVLHKNHSIAGRALMIDALETKTLAQIPPDAASLRTWLARASSALSQNRP